MVNLLFNSTTKKLIFSQANGNKLVTSCGGPGICSNCTDSTPQVVVAEISGMANGGGGGCSDCADLDGSWTLVNGGASDPCRWYGVDTISLCDGHPSYSASVQLILDFSDSSKLQLYWKDVPPNTSVYDIWEYSTGGAMSCQWENFDVPRFGCSACYCDSSSATATLNATMHPVVWFPAEAGGGWPDLWPALWNWELMDGVGTPLLKTRRGKKVNRGEYGVGTRFARMLEAWGIRPDNETCSCRSLKKQMDDAGPEAIQLDFSTWADRIIRSADQWSEDKLLKSAWMTAARYAVPKLLQKACEDEIKRVLM